MWNSLNLCENQSGVGRAAASRLVPTRRDTVDDLDFDDAGSDESVGQARLKPRAAPQWRFGAEAEVEVEYEGVGNWHAAFVERVVTVHGDDRYDVVINDEGTPHLVRNVHRDRLRPRS